MCLQLYLLSIPLGYHSLNVTCSLIIYYLLNGKYGIYAAFSFSETIFFVLQIIFYKCGNVCIVFIQFVCFRQEGYVCNVYYYHYFPFLLFVYNCTHYWIISKDLHFMIYHSIWIMLLLNCSIHGFSYFYVFSKLHFCQLFYYLYLHFLVLYTNHFVFFIP